jgi:L-rhamnose mutarotase
MRRFGQMIQLKPECVEEYIRLHQPENIFKGVNEMIRVCNITRYSIYFKDNILFAYFEYSGNDFDTDMQKMAVDKNTQKWWDAVKPLMQPVENIKPGEFWANMEEIYHLD